MIGQFQLTDFTLDNAATYKAKIDANWQATQQIAAAFQTYANSPAAMTVKVAAGSVLNGTALTQVAIQTSGTITAPVTNPRIDRVVIDQVTGTASIVTGTEAASPVAPAIPAGKIPSAQIALTVGMATITNSAITDERLGLPLYSALPLTGGTLTGALVQAVGSAVASAATINLTNVVGNACHVTGTTPITAITLATGKFCEVIFDGILTLTHHATNNNLPGAINITTAAGDRAYYFSDGTTVYCVAYQKASGAPITMSPITNSLAADVALNNIANFFDGPSVAQGTVGTWFVSGRIESKNTGVAGDVFAKLWDGTTVIDSAYIRTPGAGFNVLMAFSGFITNPAGNLRISAKDTASTAGLIVANVSGLTKDSTITAIRIG